MADIVVEHTTEPDPAATAIGNDQEVNDVEDTGPSATTETALPAAAEATARTQTTVFTWFLDDQLTKLASRRTETRNRANNRSRAKDRARVQDRTSG